MWLIKKKVLAGGCGCDSKLTPCTSFLVANRAELIRSCRAKVAQRPAPEARGKEFGIAFFLDQLIETLQAEKAVDPARVCVVSGSSGDVASSLSEMVMQRRSRVGSWLRMGSRSIRWCTTMATFARRLRSSPSKMMLPSRRRSFTP